MKIKHRSWRLALKYISVNHLRSNLISGTVLDNAGVLMTSGPYFCKQMLELLFTVAFMEAFIK